MTKVQQLRQRIQDLRESGTGAGWDSFLTEDMTDAENAIQESQKLFRDARKAVTVATKVTLLFNGKMALERAKYLIESWEGDE